MEVGLIRLNPDLLSPLEGKGGVGHSGEAAAVKLQVQHRFAAQLLGVFHLSLCTLT